MLGKNSKGASVTVPRTTLRVRPGTVRPVTATSGNGRTGGPYRVVRPTLVRSCQPCIRAVLDRGMSTKPGEPYLNGRDAPSQPGDEVVGGWPREQLEKMDALPLAARTCNRQWTRARTDERTSLDRPAAERGSPSPFQQAQKFAMLRSSKRDPGRGEQRRTGPDIRRRYGERFHRRLSSAPAAVAPQAPGRRCDQAVRAATRAGRRRQAAHR